MVNEISNKTLSLQGNRVGSDVDVKPIKSESVKPISIANEQNNSQQSSESIIFDTVDRLNTAVQSIERDLQFRVDDDSGDTIIKVLDSKTEEVIRQIPTEEVLAVRENIESLKGILFSAKV